MSDNRNLWEFYKRCQTTETYGSFVNDVGQQKLMGVLTSPISNFVNLEFYPTLTKC